MADDRKTDPAAGKPAGNDAASPAKAAAQTPPVGAPGLRRDPPIIEGKATEIPAATDAKANSGSGEAKPADVKAAARPEPSHVRPAAPGAPARPPAPARDSGVGAGMAALLGGVAGAVLAIAASMLLNRGDPQLVQRVATLEQQLRSLPSVDSAGIAKRLADLETQAKAVAGQAQSAAEAAKSAGQAAADSSGAAKQAQGLAAAAAQTGDANKAAIAALPRPAPAADLGPLTARLDQAGQATEKLAAEVRAAQAAAADRIAKLEARPVVTLDKVEARLGQLEQAGAALKPMQDRLALVEAAAKEAQAKLDARFAAIETATVAATATATRAAASIDERLARTDQAVAQAGQQLAQQAQKTDQSLAAAGQSLAQTGDRLGALEQRVAGIDLKPLADRVAALDGRFAPVEAKIAETSSAVQGAATRVAAAQAQTQATRAAVAADAVLRALAAGRPYAAEVATLEGVGVKPEALAPLKPFAEKGAPTGAQLAADFAPLADTVAAAGAPKAAESSFGDRLLNAAGRIVKVRRIGDAAATDATSLAGRIEESLQRGDVADALKAYAALPDASRSASREFGDRLAARARADEAARALTRDAYAALAQPKN